MLLSIVIPFYQVEAYLPACLDRLIPLDPGECEALLVDDCGTDKSAEIAAQYAEKYPLFRVIRREQNGGLSAARNTGLAQAKGEYVYFLDSDDLPETQALLSLAHLAKDKQLDVAKARFAFFDDVTGRRTPGPAIPQTQVLPGGELFASQCKAGLYEPMVWQCIYRRDFLAGHQLVMADGLLFEDELFQAPALLAAARTMAVEDTILLYRQREGSIMGGFAKSARWCASYLEICRRLTALSKALPAGKAQRALQRRIGQIALSVGKNIPAYHLPPDVKRDALAFLSKNRRELAGYAIRSGDMLVAAQGLLLALSQNAFLACYSRASSTQITEDNP